MNRNTYKKPLRRNKRRRTVSNDRKLDINNKSKKQKGFLNKLFEDIRYSFSQIGKNKNKNYNNIDNKSNTDNYDKNINDDDKPRSRFPGSADIKLFFINIKYQWSVAC